MVKSHMRKRGRKLGVKQPKGYKALIKTGWTYGTEEEQNWLMRELGRDGFMPEESGKGIRTGLNRYLALKAIQVWCGMSPAARNPMGLYRRMEIAMAMLLPGYQTMQRWVRDGVQVDGRPELNGNWWKLAAMADRGEYDPAAGGCGKTVLNLMRSSFVKKKLMETIENLLGDEEFLKQLKADPKTLLELCDRAAAFEKLDMAKTGAGEMSPEQFKKMFKDLVYSDPATIGQLAGKAGRKKLRKAWEVWDDE